MGNLGAKPSPSSSNRDLAAQDRNFKPRFRVGDRVMFLFDEEGKPSRPEAGTVRWNGYIDECSKTDICVGIEFDNQLNLGSGWYNNQQIFTCELGPGHGGFFYEGGLILEKDFHQEQRQWNGSADGRTGFLPATFKDNVNVTQPQPQSPITVENLSLSSPEEDETDVVMIPQMLTPPKINDTSSHSPVPVQPSTSKSDSSEPKPNHRPRPPIYNNNDFDPLGFVDQLEGPNPVNNPNAESDAGDDKRRRLAGSTPEPGVSNSNGRANEVSMPMPMDMDCGAGEGGQAQAPCRSYSTWSDDDSDNDSDRGNPMKPRSQPLRRPPSSVSYELQQRRTNSPSVSAPSAPYSRDSGTSSPPPPSAPYNFVPSPPWTRITYHNMGSRTNKGIQGFNNSCYLDSSLFSMYSFMQIFDGALKTVPDRRGEDPVRLDLHKVMGYLRRIVNKLRHPSQFVPSDDVLQLRQAMACLDPKFTDQERDCQEFLQHLFKSVFQLPEFLQLSNGQNDYFHQILLPESSEPPMPRIPTLQQLLISSFQFQNLKLKSGPDPVLIVQVPREAGSNGKQYAGVLPTQTIDISDLLVNRPEAPVLMHLFAVICIQTNHFVSFVRVPRSEPNANARTKKPADGDGNGNGAQDEYDPWVLFDSMYYRSGSGTQLTPLIEKLPCMGEWLERLDEAAPLSEQVLKEIDENERLRQLQRMLRDAYMCFYMLAS